MGEPNRNVHRKAVQREAQPGQSELFATDVLLIADSATDHGHEHGNGGNGTTPVEPLDMESVVRKLIALLDEQQP